MDRRCISRSTESNASAMDEHPPRPIQRWSAFCRWLSLGSPRARTSALLYRRISTGRPHSCVDWNVDLACTNRQNTARRFINSQSKLRREKRETHHVEASSHHNRNKDNRPPAPNSNLKEEDLEQRLLFKTKRQWQEQQQEQEQVQVQGARLGNIDPPAETVGRGRACRYEGPNDVHAKGRRSSAFRPAEALESTAGISTSKAAEHEDWPSRCSDCVQGQRRHESTRHTPRPASATLHGRRPTAIAPFSGLPPATASCPGRRSIRRLECRTCRIAVWQALIELFKDWKHDPVLNVAEQLQMTSLPHERANTAGG